MNQKEGMRATGMDGGGYIIMVGLILGDSREQYEYIRSVNLVQPPNPMIDGRQLPFIVIVSLKYEFFLGRTFSP